MSVRRTFKEYEKEAVYEKFNGCCAICGKALTRKNMTIAHMVPLSKGGTNGLDNLLLACWHCSHAKQNLSMEDFLGKILEILEHNQEEIEKLNIQKASDEE